MLIPKVETCVRNLSFLNSAEGSSNLTGPILPKIDHLSCLSCGNVPVKPYLNLAGRSAIILEILLLALIE